MPISIFFHAPDFNPILMERFLVSQGGGGVRLRCVLPHPWAKVFPWSKAVGRRAMKGAMCYRGLMHHVVDREVVR